MNLETWGTVGAILLAAAGSSGCSSARAPDPGAGPDGDAAYAATPAAVLTSDAGRYRIAIQSAPDPQPTRGVNALRLVFTKASDGTRAAGLEVDVVPWMPAMGHGASVKPTVHAGTEPGVYTVDHVNLFMPGLWEIRATIGGSTGDHATAQFEVQ